MSEPVILRVAVPASLGAHDSPDTLAVVEATIAGKATSWSQPTYQGEADGQHHYLTDAQPRPVGITTLANVAPALLRPHIIK